MKGRVLAALAALSLAAASQAHANGFVTYCNSGQSLTTCASVKIETTALPGGGTHVRLFIRNLEGTIPQATAPGLISEIGLAGVDPGTLSNLVVSADGTVQVVGTPGSQWQLGGNLSELNNPGIAVSNPPPGDPKIGGILGCTSSPTPSSYFQTCDGDGFTGAVVFDFDATNDFTAEELFIAWKVQGDEGSFECITDPTTQRANCTGTPPGTTVPEPISMTLLATGLAGMGGMGALRRRRKQNS